MKRQRHRKILLRWKKIGSAKTMNKLRLNHEDHEGRADVGFFYRMKLSGQ